MRLHCIGLLLAGAVCATGTTLTGLTEFTTNGSGAWPLGGASYNTHGGDGAWNVYVTAPNSGPNGAFLNSGNAAGASLNVDISAPGTYTFYFYGQGTTLATAGLNLFFNGALPQSAPGISAFGAVNGTSFSANGASSTLPLSYNGGTFPGANSLALSMELLPFY